MSSPPSPPPGGLGSSPNVRALPKSTNGEGLTRAQLAAQQHDSPSLLSHLPRPSSPDTTSIYTTHLSGTGFHPTLVTTFPTNLTPPDVDWCSLTLLYHLPAEIILDPYQLGQLHQDRALAYPALSAVDWKMFGETELELPVSRVGKEGTGLMIRLVGAEETERVEVPVHGRYLEALTREEEEERGLRWWEGAQREVEVGWPWVGWVCGCWEGEGVCEDSGAVPAISSYTLPPPFPSNFSSLHDTGYSSCHPLRPSSPNPISTLTLPVGRASHLPLVELSTTLAIWLTAGWVAYKGFLSFRKMDRRRASRKSEKVE